MQDDLDEAYLRDRRVWDSCADTYEQEIVEGHPDVTAYEAFEEDLLDRVLLHLIRDRRRKVHLFDVGCGSARLHLRYGLKTRDASVSGHEERVSIAWARRVNPGCQFDPDMAEGLVSVGGIDFSARMIELAREKMASAGLTHLLQGPWFFEEGSAFDLQPMADEPLPLVVSVCNSIGVMQGPPGAIELFKAMRRAVESSNGIAIITAYRGEAVESFALGNYESTMNVCGQPRWLEPDDYAAPAFTKVPRAYKRGHDPDSSITVDVFDADGLPVKEGFSLRRDPAETRRTIDEGHIRTHTDYESHWYSFEQFEEWIADLWPEGSAHHLAGISLDALRAEPVQLAILDMGGLLSELLDRWRA